MPEISTLLERAAAEPHGVPDVVTPLRRQRHRRQAAGASVLAVAVLFPIVVVARQEERGARVQVTTPPSSGTSYRDTANRFSVVIPEGFSRAELPLAPWLRSPFDILNVATTALEPSPLPSNQAICPSEIPKVIANGIGAEGASLTIREWRPGEGFGNPEPRPLFARDLDWLPGCELPNGMTNFTATFRDAGRDFTAQIVLGANAQAKRATLEDVVDSFHPDPPADRG